VVKEEEKRSEERKIYSLKENIKKEKLAKKMDRGQLNKRKNPPVDALEHLAEKKEEQDGEALKIRVAWDLGFLTPRVLAFRVLKLRPWSKVFRESV
jgi:hypothetical protein